MQKNRGGVVGGVVAEVRGHHGGEGASMEVLGRRGGEGASTDGTSWRSGGVEEGRRHRGGLGSS